MMSKKDLKQCILDLEDLIEKITNDDRIVVSAPFILNSYILCMGKRPHIIPKLASTSITDESELHDATLTDLYSIRCMLIGILNNYSNYKDKNKFCEFIKETILKIGTVSIEALANMSNYRV